MAHRTELVCVGVKLLGFKIQTEVSGEWDLGVLLDERCVLLRLGVGIIMP